MKDSMNNIHRNARIGRNVEIGPFTTIEEDVVIGDGCRIGANASVLNGTRMGNHCRIFPGAVVGAAPQDLKFEGKALRLKLVTTSPSVNTVLSTGVRRQAIKLPLRIIAC